MKRLKIRDKLIIINISIFLFIFLSQFAFQNIFFNKYYNYYKQTKLEDSINEFKKVLHKDNFSNEYINKKLNEDEILISYLDKDMNVIKGDLTNEIKLSIKDKDNKVINLSVAVMPLYGSALITGDFIKINGFKLKNDDKLYIENLIITKKGESVQQNDKSILNISGYNIDFEKESRTTAQYEGEVISFSSIDEKKLSHKLAIESYLNCVGKNNIKEGNITINDFNQKYLINLKKIDNNYVLASTPLQGSEGIIEILNDFNIYIILLTLVLAILIIYIYSKKITKPLLEMKEVAKSISNQDFDKEVHINSKDELQDLGESLNNISSNLKSKINQLKGANKKLKQEYEERLEIEKNQNFLLINISHDLKTPLTIIKGYLKAIKDGIYSKEEYIDYTIDGVDEISATLNEMLEITKLKSKSYCLDIQIADFTRLVYKTYDKLKYLARQKQQIVRFNLEDDIFVNIDEREMKKVIENLITNAIKYSPNKMNINIDLIEKDDSYVFTIENEGVNIPEEDINNVFNEFYRVDKSRNKKTRGNGLGLVIVKVILEAHSIEYSIKNNNKGVKFDMYLPKLLNKAHENK